MGSRSIAVACLALLAAVSGPAIAQNENLDESIDGLLYYADWGRATAQVDLAYRYYYGEGIDQDYAEAMRWFREAASRDFVEAEFALGFVYSEGKAVPQDYAEAAKWYQRAAAKGYASAQYNLGVLYQNGEGVEQDYTEALYLYGLAAGQGYTDAQFNLGVMHEAGQGSDPDLVEAYKWFNLAARTGDAEAAQRRDALSENMTPEQIAEASRLTAEWLESNSSD